MAGGRWVLPTYHLTESTDLSGLWVGPILTTMEAGTHSGKKNLRG
jgi:hypothetical protein